MMITAQLDLSRLVHKLNAAPAVIHSVVKKKFNSEARLLVSSSGNVPGLVQVTAPSQSKSNNAAKKRGEISVARDIRRVYATPGKVYELIQSAAPRLAAPFWIAVKAKDWTRANQLARHARVPELIAFTDDDGAAHQARRKHGVVTSKKPTVGVQDPRYLAAYIKKTQGHVGLLASSLVAAAKPKLGTINGVPQWIARHSGPWGTCDVITGEDKFYVIIGLTDHAEDEMRRKFGYVLKYRYAAIERQIPYIKRAALKAAKLPLT